MRRPQERGTKVRLNFSGGPHAPVNMADNIDKVNVSGKKNTENGTFTALYCTIFRTPRNSWSSSGLHRRFKSRNSRTTGILHTIRHVYRSVWCRARPFCAWAWKSLMDNEIRSTYVHLVQMCFHTWSPAIPTTAWMSLAWHWSVSRLGASPWYDVCYYRIVHTSAPA